MKHTKDSLCVDAGNGSRMYYGTCDSGNKFQQFKMKKDGDYYEMKHVATDKCADYGADGDYPYLMSCNSGDFQRWKLEDKNAVKNKGKEGCFDGYGGKLWVSGCNNGDFQTFDLQSV